MKSLSQLRSIGVVFALVSLVLVSFQVQAQERCGAAFISYGEMWPSFKLNKEYSKEVKFQSAVRNQGTLGSCHVQAMMAMLEQRYTLRTGENIRLSSQYITLLHWIGQVVNGLNDKASLKVNLGASIEQSILLVMRYGLMPETAWKARKDFEPTAIAGRMEEFAQNIIARGKLRLQKAIDPAEKELIVQESVAGVLSMFQQVVGAPPKTFIYNNLGFKSPQAFAAYMFPELKGRFVQIYVNPDKKEAPMLFEERKSDIYVADLKAVEQAIKDNIDQGKSVYMAYEHNHKFVDYNSGTMSIGAFKIPSNGGPLSRQDRGELKIGDGGHAVQIVGYEVDPKTGDIIRLKILNSWGTARGDKGYYHMYKDYFRAYVRGVMFPKDSDVKLPTDAKLPPKQLELSFEEDKS